MSANLAFKTARGEQLALELAKHIVETEHVQNWDECLDDIREKVCRLGDKKLGAPISALVRAEEMNHLIKKVKQSRYRVNIREVI